MIHWALDKIQKAAAEIDMAHTLIQDFVRTVRESAADTQTD